MCGIVGAVAQRNVSQILLEGLSRLEYRGYDSAGICTIDNNTLNCIKTTGKVKNLKEKIIQIHNYINKLETQFQFQL